MRGQTRQTFPAPEAGPPLRRARWALVIVALLEVGLFAQHHWDQWRHGLLHRGAPQTRTGEGLVITSDGLGYYAWLRSALVDHDWSFANEFDEHNPRRCGLPTAVMQTPAGRRGNPWPVGPACVWAVAVVPGHFLVQGLQALGLPWPADGYSLPYQLLVGLTTLAAALLGVALLFGICRRYARPERAALATACLVLGTTVVYYSSVEVTMAHGLGTVALAGLAVYWLSTYGSDRPGRWLRVGLLIGVAALMRHQLATFAVLPAGEALLAALARPRSLGRSAVNLGIAAAGTVLAFLPQMVAWRCVYGSWLATPIPLASNWLRPALWEVLGSQDRSLFYWTPLSLLACLGFLCLGGPRRPAGERGEPGALATGGSRRPLPPVADAPGSPPQTTPGVPNPARAPLALLAVGFVVHVYALASIRGIGVFLGSAYGFRQLTETMVVLAPGLALLLDRAGPCAYRLLGLLGGGLMGWNLVLIGQYCNLLLPADAGAAPALLLKNVLVLVHHRPLQLAGLIAGPLVLTYLLGRPEPPGLPAAEVCDVPHRGLRRDAA